MRTHGLLQNCERCSVVAFNEEQIKNHEIQHVPSAGKQQVVYVCSKCMTTYSTVRSELILNTDNSGNSSLGFDSFIMRQFLDV